MTKIKSKIILSLLLAIVILFGVVVTFDTKAIASDIDSTTIVEDKLKPVVEYAYVEDGKIKISIFDNEELAKKPIIYRINNELRSYVIDIKDYENENF